MVNWDVKRDRNNPDLVNEKSLEDVLKARQFECLVKWPLNWKLKAQLLLIAAEKIFAAYDAAYKRDLERILAVPFGQKGGSHTMEGEELEDFLDSQLLPICLLLKGFAVENLIKGIIFSKNPKLLDDKTLCLDGDITNHDLCDLYAEKAGLAKNKESIDPETKEILVALEQIIRWQGRYPTPKNIEIFRQMKQIPNSLKDQKKVNELCWQLFAILNKIPNPPTHLSERT
jgi:hypothetical protein